MVPLWSSEKPRVNERLFISARQPPASFDAAAGSNDRLHYPRLAVTESVETAEAREVIIHFHGVIRRKALTELDEWIERAKGSLVAAFANGIAKDKAAVAAAVSAPWSNGQTEGQICKLKLVKRQMYGRGKLDLLQARVVGLS